jgi:acetate kinase
MWSLLAIDEGTERMGAPSAGHPHAPACSSVVRRTPWDVAAWRHAARMASGSAEPVLVVNAGSSTLKLALVGAGEEPPAAATEPMPPADAVEDALRRFLEDGPAPAASGHRVVHGGEVFAAPVLVDDAVEQRLAGLAELAPLHTPPALRALHATRQLLPGVPAVACFDTAFHADLPAAAATYAVPAEWRRRWGLRRFGFHGLSHAWAAQRVSELLGAADDGLRLIVAHLGAGASLAAIRGVRSVDTTMGFTPLDGLVMATRAGAVDPGLLLWVQRHGGLDADATEQALESRSGLLALSERSADLREVLAGVDAGDERCRLAVDVYVHRLAAGIASMAAALGGLDALAFTAGVGEGSPRLRALAAQRLAFLGVELDPAANDAAAQDGVISRPGARVVTLVIRAREDLEIARQVRTLLA